MIDIDPSTRVPKELQDMFREMIAGNEIIYSMLVYPSNDVDDTYIRDAANEAQMRLKREIVPLTRSTVSWKMFLSAMKISHARVGVAIDAALEQINTGD